MNRSTAGILRVLGVASIATILIATSPAQVANAGSDVSTGAGAADFQVLTSGPLHESFARPIVFGGIGAYYVAATPPPFFEEVPPLQRPAGFSEWVPGYWSPDDAQQGWIWVSGTWRVPPPGYTWVPGYWSDSERGWRHVGGYWAPTASMNTEIDYFPLPPDPIDVGAVGTAPFSDAIWAPGNWMWAGTRYSWRNGYFVRARPDWVWTPANYTWTPNGYVFQDGFWDHDLTRRGLLYAPVAFRSGAAMGSGFRFSPDSVINVGLFSDSLFVRPLSDQYYFGDYYATSWWDRGVYPAFSFHMSRFGYDPLFAYASWQGVRGNPTWLDDRRTGFRNLQAHPEARPQAAVVAIVARDAAAARITPLEIVTVPESDRQVLAARAKEAQQARAERIKLEAQAGVGAEVTQPRKVKISKDLLPGAAEAAKSSMAMPDRPEIPKVETDRQPEAVKGDARRLVDPSMDRPVDHVGRAGGNSEPMPVGAKADAANPNPPKPPEVGQPARKPDPVKVEPQPPKRAEVVPPAPKPDAGKQKDGKPEGRVEPAKRPEDPRPTPKPEGGKPQPVPTPKPDGGKPQPTPAPKPDGGKPQPTPAPKPDGGKPQPTPAPKPDGGKPAPAPAPKEGGNPGQKHPDGKPGLDAPDSRPKGAGSLMS